MGIIMLDRVGEYESSERIPQIIVANNFQFTLNTEMTVQTSTVQSSDKLLVKPATRAADTSKPIIEWK